MQNKFSANKFVGVSASGSPVRERDLADEMAELIALANAEDAAVEEMYLGREAI